ncbi:MAG: sigma-70 family RNA polymerase sigma factor [Bacteroidetes bacterium]|nr:sigma-70 family RNA polymerase sigma factor [Bacteroidota bacterium]
MDQDEMNRALWQKIREADQQSLFDLYDAVYFHLVRFGLKIIPQDEVVKDAIMALFFKIWDNRKKLSEVSNVKSYLFTALKRALLDKVANDEKVSKAIKEYSFEKERGEELAYEEIIIIAQEDELLRNKLSLAIKQLTPKQGELIRLKFYEGLSYEEVALQTSQSIKTAYNTIYNAITTLRAHLK